MKFRKRAKNFKILLLEKDVTRYELMKRTGISHSHLNGIVGGNIDPSLSKVAALAEALGMGAGEFVEKLLK